jgi:uncharacterized membrane protein YgcG
MKKVYLAVMLLLPFVASAFELPANDGYMTDAVGVLIAEQEQQVEDQLRAFHSESEELGQIAAVIVPSLGNVEPRLVAEDAADRWGLGGDEQYYLFILVDFEVSRAVIVAGSGYSETVPPEVEEGIATQIMQPLLADDQFAEALTEGIGALQKHISGDYRVSRYRHAGRGSVFLKGLLILCLVFVQWMLAFFNRKAPRVWGAALLGLASGVVFVALWGWWLSIPLLFGLGLIMDALWKNQRGLSRIGRLFGKRRRHVAYERKVDTFEDSRLE